MVMTASRPFPNPISVPDSLELLGASPITLAAAAQLVGPHQRGITPKLIEDFVNNVFGEDLHAKRVLSMANGVIGVMHAASLAIHAVGRGLAMAKGGLDKHTVKQVDRFLSNRGIALDVLGPMWIHFVLADRKRVFINLDWTEFDGDDHSMLVASVQTEHGRSTPLLWKTIQKSLLKGKRNDHEDEMMRKLREAIAEDVQVILVADRGFADQKFFAFLLEELRFDYIIRFKSNTTVTSAKGESRAAKAWVGKNGRMRRLKDATLTADGLHVPQVMVVQDKGMKEVWCIATSLRTITGSKLKIRYGKRFSCEEMFRDIKDIRYGMGLSWTHIKRTDRRDRLFLLAVLAFALLVLLGAAGESVGMDKQLKTTTKPGRQYSLFRQGMRWFELLPWIDDDRARPLLKRFGEMLQAHAVFRAPFGVL